MNPSQAGPDILVIKLGALGDFVLAAGPFAAIRRHHPTSRITLLTTPPFADFARAAPWFDAVWVDARPRLWNLPGVLRLRRLLRARPFGRVYDLQTSDRSSWYRRLLPGAVEWSGIAPGCSHPHANPRRDFMHTLERQAEQLAMAGIASVEAADFSWVTADTGRFGLTPPYVLLVPGGAAHRPAKRWPVTHYAALARFLAERKIQPVILGSAQEGDLAATIRSDCPAALDLTGATGLFDIAALARGARMAIGNDTGPMHLVAAAGCPSIVLFSEESDPALCAPRGRVTILRRPSLDRLELEAVQDAIDRLGGKACD